MKVQLEIYNPKWQNWYHNIQKELSEQLQILNPIIEHIGSTAVLGLSAKPIIDILVGVPKQFELDECIEPLTNKGYLFYKKYNSIMPYRRFFVMLQTKPENIILPSVYYENDVIPNELNKHKLAHIHILEHNSYHWLRHIAFREYIRKHCEVKNEYQKIKMQLSTKEWKDGNEYNAAKNDFIKMVEEKQSFGLKKTVRILVQSGNPKTESVNLISYCLFVAFKISLPKMNNSI